MSSRRKKTKVEGINSTAPRKKESDFASSRSVKNHQYDRTWCQSKTVVSDVNLYSLGWVFDQNGRKRASTEMGNWKLIIANKTGFFSGVSILIATEYCSIMRILCLKTSISDCRHHRSWLSFSYQAFPNMLSFRPDRFLSSWFKRSLRFS